MGKARKGLFFALVGPGGAGKTTLLKEALKQIDNLRQLATATTRAPRAGETHGCERYFLSKEEFIEQIHANAFYEYEEVHPGTFYGTPRTDIDAALLAGCDLIADIDAKGACFLRVALPENLLLIFVAPPNITILRKRLEGRGDEETATQARIDRFAWEMSFADVCDEIIVNETLAGAVATLKSVVEKARYGQRNAVSLPNFASVLAIRENCIHLYGNQANLPRSPLRNGELPHEAALRVVEDQLHASCRRESLSPGQIAAQKFTPILQVKPSSNAVEFQYVYALAPDELLPDGWRAYSLEQAPISSETRISILTRFQQRNVSS